MTRLECPSCTTSYPSARCGVEPVAGTLVVVVCPVCGAAFSIVFELTDATQTWGDWLLRRPAAKILTSRSVVRRAAPVAEAD